MAAIVASLVFVGLELRQSHEIALAAQYQARTDSGRLYFYESLKSEHRIAVLAGDIKDWEWPDRYFSSEDQAWLAEQPLEELAEASYWATINLYGFDNYYYQYQSGFLSEEGWRALEARLLGMLLEDPIARHLVAVQGETFRASFVAMSLELISSRAGEPDGSAP